MSKRRAHAVAEARETRSEAEKNPEATKGTEAPKVTENESAPRGPAQSPLRMATFLWGIPILLFITIAVLKECVGVSIW